MEKKHGYRFETARLLVDSWDSFQDKEWIGQNLTKAVQQILTREVTKSLPPAWQGDFTDDRAQKWIAERNSEGPTLLAVEKSDKQPVGMVIMFDAKSDGHLRLGYMLKESSWGKGYASELVEGFVDWCHQKNIKSITGGVESDNTASRRVLEKCGFRAVPPVEDSSEIMYVLKF